MERLLDGIRQFQKDVYPNRKDLFEQLAGVRARKLYLLRAPIRASCRT